MAFVNLELVTFGNMTEEELETQSKALGKEIPSGTTIRNKEECLVTMDRVPVCGEFIRDNGHRYQVKTVEWIFDDNGGNKVVVFATRDEDYLLF